MGRLARKLNPPAELLDSGGIFDLFDNEIKSIFRITDSEYDAICKDCSDEELETLVSLSPTFSQKRQIIETLNKYIP